MDEFILSRYKDHHVVLNDPYFRLLVSESIGFKSYLANYHLGIAVKPFKNRLQKYFNVIIKLIQSWKIN